MPATENDLNPRRYTDGRGRAPSPQERARCEMDHAGPFALHHGGETSTRPGPTIRCSTCRLEATLPRPTYAQLDAFAGTFSWEAYNRLAREILDRLGED